jgi:hypothetical protein
MKIDQAIAAFRQFCGSDLTITLTGAEAAIRGATQESLSRRLGSFAASEDALYGAGQLKRLLGQLNVVIHALGILRCLPEILEPGETVLDVSLGAGNTGRPFDLETDRRIAEFKFIQWQGGPESIRQNNLFKDFFLLAEYDSPKRKELYVLGTEHPLKFLNGGRALVSVLKDASLQRQFQAKFGDRYRTVREYYQPRQSAVAIRDASAWLSGLSRADVAAAESEV